MTTTGNTQTEEDLVPVLADLVVAINWYLEHQATNPLELDYLASTIDDVLDQINAAIEARPEET